MSVSRLRLTIAVAEKVGRCSRPFEVACGEVTLTTQVAAASRSGSATGAPAVRDARAQRALVSSMLVLQARGTTRPRGCGRMRSPRNPLKPQYGNPCLRRLTGLTRQSPAQILLEVRPRNYASGRLIEEPPQVPA